MIPAGTEMGIGHIIALTLSRRFLVMQRHCLVFQSDTEMRYTM